MADQEVDDLFGGDGQALDAKPAAQTQKDDSSDGSGSSSGSDSDSDSDDSTDSSSSDSSSSSSSSSGSDKSAGSSPRKRRNVLGAKKRQRGKQAAKKARPKRLAKKRKFGEDAADAPKRQRNGDSDDERDSREEAKETAEDRGFIDDEDDDKELMKEYSKDKQDWSDDEEDRPKRRKGRKDDSEDITGENRTKSGKRKGLSDEEKADLVLKTLRLMRKAAQQDIEDKQAGKPAVAKLKALAEVRKAVAKEELAEMLLGGLDNSGMELASRIGAGRDSKTTIMEMFREWLRPLPGSEMPNLQLREAIYDMLSVQRLGRSIEHHHLGDSRLGPILFALSHSPRETEANRIKLKQLIDKVSAEIFNKKHVYKAGITDMLMQQEALGLTTGPRAAAKAGTATAASSASAGGTDAIIDSLLGSSQQSSAAAAHAAAVLPKDLPRHARIPTALVFDYTHRPQAQAVDRAQKAQLGAGAQGLVKKMVEDKRQKKMGLVRGVKISIEGRGADT